MADKATTTAKAKNDAKKLTKDRVMADFRVAYEAKRKLIEREREDFLFALGEQWSHEDQINLRTMKIRPITDNRIQPNLFLLTGLERQNRTDFKAFPIGEEDGIKADIVTALFKDAIKKSDFNFKSSDQFKDGITCGESHLELYLDYTESLINGAPRWRKCDGYTVLPDPASREYDFDDAKFVIKLTTDLAREDLINLFPKKEKQLKAMTQSKVDVSAMLSTSGTHVQPKDYPSSKDGSSKGTDLGLSNKDEDGFDLIERYYKKFVKTWFVGDKKTGELTEMADEESANKFVAQYRAEIASDEAAYKAAVTEKVVAAHAAVSGQMMAQAAPQPAAAAAMGPSPAPAQESAKDKAEEGMAQEMAEGPEQEAPEPIQTAAVQPAPMAPAAPPELTPELHDQIAGMLEQNGQLPPPPPQRDPERFLIVSRQVPEIWCFSMTPGLDEPLADERAWFYPKWKHYPFVTYFARFSTAPLKGDDRHLLIQGIVHGVKGAQEKHNKAEMLMIRHLNSATNSGWLSEEDSWVDPQAVRDFGTAPGTNLEYKKGSQPPSRIEPMPLSAGHAEISASSAEAIKLQLGINADLLATQQGGTDSGRAIALRQKQGLLMVQELFDNLSRSRAIAGRMLMSQMGEMYDTETVKKVLGTAFLKKNFPPPMLQSEQMPAPGQPPQQVPMNGPDGQPMEYDEDMAELAIADILKGTLDEYEVTVGETAASDTILMANAGELKDLAATYPGLVPPDVLIKNAMIPEAAKTEILAALERQQAAQAAAAAAPHPPVVVPHGPARPAPRRK